MRRSNAFGRIRLSVCPVRALTFEHSDLETSFWYAGTSSVYLGQVRVLRSSGQGHRSMMMTTMMVIEENSERLTYACLALTRPR